MEEVENLKEENQELKEEIERINRINDSLIRQIKERANASKGQYPKKQHTGYSLVSSVQKEYRYYKSGNHRTGWIFETVFQTPYDISFQYEDVKESVYDDFYETKDDNKTIIERLGFSDCFDYRTYPEVYEGDLLTELKSSLIKKYKEQYDAYSVPDDVLAKIRDYTQDVVNRCCYNLNVRMNGKTGYWEVSINHIEPIKNLPPELRFPVGMKKKKNDGKQQKKDN